MDNTQLEKEIIDLKKQLLDLLDLVNNINTALGDSNNKIEELQRRPQYVPVPYPVPQYPINPVQPVYPNDYPWAQGPTYVPNPFSEPWKVNWRC